MKIETTLAGSQELKGDTEFSAFFHDAIPLSEAVKYVDAKQKTKKPCQDKKETGLLSLSVHIAPKVKNMLQKLL